MTARIVTRFHLAERSWPAYGAARWSLVFAVLHTVWATGWYVGLDAEIARKVFQTTWKLVYDIVIAGMCVLGLFLALAFIQPWGQRLPRWGINFVGWCATGLLLLRSGGSIVQMIYLAVIGKLNNILHPMVLWELWFYLGTTLFCLSFWRFRRDSRLSGSRRRR
ncbi:MAG: DUF3995 domain-containing protein [Acidobacteriia bacterium]|nr:DUF3995 domain-containing protein [Terriglobia bacterium]